MQKKDLLELKKRLKKDKHNIDRIAGRYVDAEGNTVMEFTDNFLGYEDAVAEKYLAILNKTLTSAQGSLHSAMLSDSEMERYMEGLRASGLKNGQLNARLFDRIAKAAEYEGGYIILFFHDTYDMITKTEDNLKLDESEEVYEYILGVICRMELAKPGLGYIPAADTIGAVERSWMVGAPELAILWPAFDDRSVWPDKMDIFTKDPAKLGEGFLSEALGLSDIYSGTPSVTEEQDTGIETAPSGPTQEYLYAVQENSEEDPDGSPGRTALMESLEKEEEELAKYPEGACDERRPGENNTGTPGYTDTPDEPETEEGRDDAGLEYRDEDSAPDTSGSPGPSRNRMEVICTEIGRTDIEIKDGKVIISLPKGTCVTLNGKAL